jgi:glycine oxidase
MPGEFDIVIIGGGVIGASIAWRLACDKRSVLLVEASKIGAEASSAAAGMLSPGGEFDDPSMLEFAVRSLSEYAEFARSIEAASGLATEFRGTGAVQIALSSTELESLNARAALQRAAGISSVILNRDELRSLVPQACDGAIGAVHYPAEAIVSPPALMASLRAACLARGVTIREDSRVTSIAASNSCVQVSFGETKLSAGCGVLSAGAWSGDIRLTVQGEPHRLPRSYPMKGHLLGFRLAPGSLAATVRHDHTYVLQRADGFTIAGSSTEDVGYDRTVDSRMVSEIAGRAASLVPALESRQPESAWIGFRPASDGPGPYMGRVQSSRLWLAYGHYRNGILLAPATSRQICQEIERATD